MTAGIECILAFVAVAVFQEPDISLLLEAAERARKEGRGKEALAGYRVVLAAKPDLVEAHLGYQKLLKSQKKDDLLLEEYRGLFERLGESWCHYLYGRVLRDAGKELELYRKGLVLAPDNFELRIALADALRRERRLGEAIREYRAVIKDRPEALREHLAYIKLMRDANKSDEAVAEYAELASTNRSDFRWALLQGGALITAGRNEQARAPLERALELSPRSPHVLVTLGVYYIKAKDYVRARDYYERSLREDPYFVGGIYQSGLLLVFVRNDEEGLRRLNEAARLEPDSSLILSDLGAALLGRGDIELAEEKLRVALRIDPTNDWAAHRMGLVAVHRKDYAEAARWQEKAIDLCPIIPHYYMALGKAHERVGNLEQAKQAFEKAERLQGPKE